MNSPLYYLDASALNKLYRDEFHSARISTLAANHRVATSRLSLVEVASALHRRERQGLLSAVELNATLELLQLDSLAIHTVELDAGIAAVAVDVLRSHALRAGDAIQLASCLYLQRSLDQPVTFVAFDIRLNEAAAAEYLTLF